MRTRTSLQSYIWHRSLFAPAHREEEEQENKEECFMIVQYARGLGTRRLTVWWNTPSTIVPPPWIALRSGTRCYPAARNRGKKTKATATLDDLPQGLVPLAPLLMEDTEPTYPTVVLQARRNMRKFENCVLLTRVGGFYELYFEQAVELGPLLNLKVAQKKTNVGPVPMVR